jgi:hypothetical protein
MHLLWLIGQFLIVVAWGAVLIGVVIAIWYGLSFLVLIAIGRLLPLRGWRRPSDHESRDGS